MPREPARRPIVRQDMPSPLSDPATFAIRRVMHPRQDDAYDPWVERVIAAAAHGGTHAATRLDQAGGIHHLLLHFPDSTALHVWIAGPNWTALANEAQRFSVGLDQQAHGVTTHFTLPAEAAARKWKTALVTWLGVVPALLAFSSLIGWAAPNWPRTAQQILSSILLTAALTWIILPRVRSWSRFWMLQDSAGKLRRDPD